MASKLLTAPEKRIIRSVFDVYLDHNLLIYVKEDCRPVDTQETFFLHITPVDDRALPEQRRQYGFDGRDFSHPGFRVDDTTCMLIRKLPDYPIRHIRTGQYTEKAQLWKGEFFMNRGAGGERQR